MREGRAASGRGSGRLARIIVMNSRLIYSQPVHGVQLGERTECSHWHSARDIVAIKFACCDTYYSCFDCHQELADHAAVARPRDRFSEPSVLCGACGRELTVDEYLGCGNVCPRCSAAFNPGCASHYHLYFEMTLG